MTHDDIEAIFQHIEDGTKNLMDTEKSLLWVYFDQINTMRKTNEKLYLLAVEMVTLDVIKEKILEKTPS